MRRTLTALALLLAAAPAAAYVIVLKDGSRLQVREKYRVAGDRAQVVLTNGARSELPLADIDVEKTEQANASDYGSALVVEAPRPAPTPPPAPEGPSLSDVASRRRLGTEMQRPETAPAAPLPEAATKNALARTPAGHVDFLRSPRTPIGSVAVGTALGEELRANGLEAAALYEGSAPGRVLVEITASSEGAVFQALVASARALLAMEAKQPQAVEALELFMATERRQRAAQFLLTPERAQELVGRKLDVTDFFLAYVEF